MWVEFPTFTGAYFKEKKAGKKKERRKEGGKHGFRQVKPALITQVFSEEKEKEVKKKKKKKKGNVNAADTHLRKKKKREKLGGKKGERGRKTKSLALPSHDLVGEEGKGGKRKGGKEGKGG